MAYQPFLIAPFSTGLDTDLQPWLLPIDAFPNIENAHIHHGYIEKRAGYRFWAEMVHGREITGASNATAAVFSVNSSTGISDGDSVSLHYLSGGSWSNLNESLYTVTGLSGTNFNLLESSGTLVNGTSLGTYTVNSGRLGTFPNLRMMGIFRYIDANNIRQTLVSDTERVALYNPASNLLQPLDLFDSTSTLRTNSPVFASTNTDFIWSANWQNPSLNNRVYFTNGKAFTGGTPGTDGIIFYDASANRVEQFQPIINSSGGILYGGKLIFSLRQRLVVLHTFENRGSTVTFPQRARWCAAQNPNNWNENTPGGGGFVDAPTGEQIISAQALQDLIIVHFTDSIWRLRSVPDPALPFKWEKINNFRACDGKMASAGYDRYSLALGQRGITATDSIETRRIDDRLEDFTSEEINDEFFGKVFVSRDYNSRRTWALYPKGTSQDSDAALIHDEESGAFSKYIFSREISNSVVDMNVLGYGETNIDYAAQDFIAANGLDKSAQDFNDGETALSFYLSSSTELFLGGDRNGFVFILDNGTSDDGNDITLSLESAGWNPYKEKGVEAQLGYIDFFLDSDQITKFKVEFYKNNNEYPYIVQDMNCLPNLIYHSDVANIVPNPDPTTGFLITSASHGISSGKSFYLYGVENAFYYNDQQWTADSVTENTISVNSDITSFASDITNITQANPALVTSPSHGFVNGDLVYIVGVSGMIEVNNRTFTVDNSTTDTFELQGVNSTGFTPYSSSGYAFSPYKEGGQIVENKFYRNKVWLRAYGGGIGYVHNVKIIQEGQVTPFRIHAFKPWFRPRGRRTLG